MKKFLLLIFLASVLAISESAAQRLYPKSPLILNLDYAKFRNDDSSGYLELYYGFYPGLVSYDQSEGRFSGFLKVHCF